MGMLNYILDQYSGAIGDMILPTLTLEAENDSNSFMSNLLAPMILYGINPIVATIVICIISIFS